MIVDGRRPEKAHLPLHGYLAGLDVQVVENLHVIAHETDGGQQDSGAFSLAQTLDDVTNIRFQPGIPRPAASALVDQFPIRYLQGRSHRPAGLPKLVHVGAVQPAGNAVGRKEKLGLPSILAWNPVPLAPDAIGDRLHKVRMGKPGLTVIHQGRRASQLFLH